MVGHGKRGGGGGSSKQASTNPAQNAEDSYIVFSSAKDDAKGKKKADTKASTSKDEVNKAPLNGEDTPKRPDTRKLIGGASWTGKLPVTLLSEHCQKQKWQKPEYTMVCCSYQIARSSSTFYGD